MSTLTQDDKKRAVARKAIDFVPDDSIIGVGTGSTVNFFIDELARIKARIDGCVSSSDASTARLKAHGIPVYELSSVGELQVYIDGADEVNHSLHMIKGGGGALTREKIVASAAREFICIADEAKYVSKLGAFRWRWKSSRWRARWWRASWCTWAATRNCARASPPTTAT